jgi:hypothetical protein
LNNCQILMRYQNETSYWFQPQGALPLPDYLPPL